jgi:hypothetical protein
VSSGHVDGLARAVRARGLASPARLLLDAHRPLRPFFFEATVVLSPLLRPLLGNRFQDTLDLLSDDANYDDLTIALGDAEHR